jgi:hypothetical protein
MAAPGPVPNMPGTSAAAQASDEDLPIIDAHEPFAVVVNKVSAAITRAVDSAYTYEQLRTSVGGQKLKPLIYALTEECHHTAVVSALLASRWLFLSMDIDGTGLSESRAYACEIVAGQFLTYLSERELIDYLLYELPPSNTRPNQPGLEEGDDDDDESVALLRRQSNSSHTAFSPSEQDLLPSSTAQANVPPTKGQNVGDDDDISESFQRLNALEIAAVANAKKFLSQTQVQKIVTDIWHGDIIFWDSLSTHSVKKAQMQSRRVTDFYARLRVPKYQKAFQVAFFASFLALYYAVLVERNPHHVTVREVFLYIWIAAFAYDEFGEFKDAGVLFYRTSPI